jgi:hypothetical protein
VLLACCYTISGIGRYDLDLLEAIAASREGENVFTFNNFDALLEDVSIILGQSCQVVKGQYCSVLHIPILFN